MNKALITLRTGSKVLHKGKVWLIESAEDFQRVLAQRLSDGRRDFLPIIELEAPVVAAETDVEAKQTSLKRHKPEFTKDSKLDLEPDLQVHMKLYQALVAVLKVPPGLRRESIRKLAVEFSISEPTVYRKIKAVEQNTTADSLHRAVRSDKRGVGSRIGPERLKIVEEVLRAKHFVETPRNIPGCMELVNSALAKSNLEEVSLSLLYKIRNKVTYRDQLLAQGRKKEARDTFRPSVDHLPNNDFPLGTVQVDHTPCQICFVDESNRMPIGDAWLTLVIDCFSRMILGFYLSFGGPSTLSTGLALSRALLPKDTLLRRMDIKGEWPCWGFPDVILVDNANELNGYMMQSARENYRFTIRNRPIGFPQFGGHVESAFKTFMDEIKTIPGTKFSNPTERAEYDSEGRSEMTLKEFEWYFTEFLVNDYHLSEHRGEGMDRRTPLQRWNAGIFEGDVFPPIGLPDIPTDARALQISLMPVEWRVINKATISIFDETYYSGALATMGDIVDPRKATEDRKFEVRYDPRDISKIWVKDPVEDSYIEATFSDLRKPSISLWEHKAQKRALGRPADEFKQQRWESKERREEFKQQSKKLTKQARRDAERAKRDAAEAITKPTAPKKPSAPTSTFVSRRTNEEIRAEMRKRLELRGDE
jgi:putative transposase